MAAPLGRPDAAAPEPARRGLRVRPQHRDLWRDGLPGGADRRGQAGRADAAGKDHGLCVQLARRGPLHGFLVRSQDGLGEHVGAWPPHGRLSRQAPDPGREPEPRPAVHLHQRHLERAGFQGQGARPGLRRLARQAAQAHGDLVRAGPERSPGRDAARRHGRQGRPGHRPADHQRRRKPAPEHALLSDPVLAGPAAGRGRRGVPATAAAHHPGRRRAAGAAGLRRGRQGRRTGRPDDGHLPPGSARPSGPEGAGRRRPFQRRDDLCAGAGAHPPHGCLHA